MLQKTDLERVKGIAKMLLKTKVHETEFSSAVVQHPFTSSGIAVLLKDGDSGRKKRYMKRRSARSISAHYF